MTTWPQRAFGALRSFVFLLLALGSPCFFGAAHADSTFIPTQSRFDFVHDPSRGFVYISSGSQILRYRLSDNTFVSPIDVGGAAQAIDLSPDGQTLAVADGAVASYGPGATPGTMQALGRIVLINLDTLAQSNKTFPLTANETGAYSLAYDYTGNILISPNIKVADPSSSDPNLAPLRRYLASSDMVSLFGDWGTSNAPQCVARNTVVSRNDDGTSLGFAETGSWRLDWGTLGIANNSLQRFNGSALPDGEWRNRPFDIGTDGTNWFFPTGGDLVVRDTANALVNTIPALSPGSYASPGAVAVDSARHLAYLGRKVDNKIEVRNSQTSALLSVLSADTFIGWTDTPYAEGHLRVSPSGTMLMQAQNGGVRLFPLQAGLPTPAPNTFSTPENTALYLPLLNPYPVSSSVTYTVTRASQHGQLNDPNTNAWYYPNWMYSGPDSFDYTVSDGTTSYSYTASITVTPVDQPFLASNTTVKTRIGTPASLWLSAWDPDDYSQDKNFGAYPHYSYEIITPPAHGTLAPDLFSYSSPNSYVYTPNAGWEGIDTFTYRALKDSGEESSLGTGTITVSGVVPVARDDHFLIRVDPTFNYQYVYVPSPGILGNDLSAEGTFYPRSSNLSAGGSIWMGNDGAIAYYQPQGEAMPTNKTITFQYNFWDGVMNSNTATVTLDLRPLLFVPAMALNGNEDTPVPFTLSGTGIAPLAYRIVAQPQHGTLSGTIPNLVYTPALNWNGSDSFSYQALESDGSASNTATVSISVSPVNDPPVVSDMTLSTAEDTAVVWTPSATDVDSTSFTFRVVTQPKNGVVAFDSTRNAWFYTPNANFNGSDSFTYVANDAPTTGIYAGIGADSNVATVSVSVSPVNDPPVATLGDLTTKEDTPLPVTLTGSDPDGDALSFSVVTLPANGTLSGTAPNLTYTPNPDWNGTDSLRYRVSDGQLGAEKSINLTVTPVNDAPRLADIARTIDEDTTADFSFSAIDPENDPVTFFISSQPSHGAVTQDTFGVWHYTPVSNYNGADSFVYGARDKWGAASTATVTITINPVNDAPYWPGDVAVALNSTVTPEDTPIEVTLKAVDPDGDPISYSLSNVTSSPVAANMAGALSIQGDKLRFAPPLNWNGRVNFILWASDGQLRGSTATEFHVSPVNDAPVAQSQSIALDEDTTKAITLSATDVDSPSLTFSLVSQPAHGTLSGTAPNLTYSPSADFNGNDSFSFKANDGQLDSNTATVSIAVNPVNDAPVAQSQNLTLDEDTPQRIVLNATDVDSTTLSYSVVSPPSHGTLSGTAPNVTYTPSRDYNGNDSFSFKANDGQLDSNAATIALMINPVNDAPVLLDQNVSLNEDEASSFSLRASDVDGDALTATLLSSPQNGKLVQNGLSFTYTPNPNWNGADSFGVKVSDGKLDSAPATVTLHVAPVDDAPLAADDAYTGALQEKTFTIPLYGTNGVTSNDTNFDGPLTSLSPEIVTQPANGTVVQNSAGFVYTPKAGWWGTDSFTYRDKTPAGLASAPATISIAVAHVNHAPVAASQSVSLNEDTPKAIALAATDADGDALSYTITTVPSHGTLSGTAPSLTYTPAKDWNGQDSFAFKAGDGALDSNVAAVSITINPVNDAPVAQSQSVSVSARTSQAITLGASDVDSPTLSFAVVTQPQHGTLSGAAPNLTYSPNITFLGGSDSFSFKANDGQLDSNVATVSITVNAVNRAPVAAAQNVTLAEDTPKAISLSATDADGDALVYAITTQPSNGTLSGTLPNVTYTPGANFNGNDSFAFKANDGKLDSAPATVSLSVTPVNDAPVASNSSVSVVYNTATALTLSASDVDGDALTYSIVASPAKGTLSGTGANRTYTPTSGYSGSDSFTFRVSDGQLFSNTATVSLSVSAQPPTAQAKSATTLEDQAVTISLSGQAYGGASISDWQVVTNPTGGTLSGGGNARTYAPARDFNGSDSFTYRVLDSRGTWSAPATVTLSVTPVNDAPSFTLAKLIVAVAKSAPAQTVTGVATGITPGPANEVGQTVTFVCSNSNTNLFSVQPMLSSSGTLSFTAKTGATGTATVQVVLQDNGGTANNGQNQSQPQNLTIKVG